MVLIRKWPLAALALATALVVVCISTVEAHKGAKGIVMERMMAMERMGDGMKAIAAMVTGKAPYDVAKTKATAVEIKKHAAGIAKQFPKGSIKGPSEALPAIWENWEAFNGHADDLTKLADQLAASADKGKTVALGLFAKMGKTCSGCHQDYRKKKTKK